MNIQDMLITMDQTSEANQPSLFPFPLGLHMAFVSIAVIFFIYRFYVQKRPYQVFIASAIFISLGFWLSESKTVYYGIGIIQVILLICALVASIIYKPSEKPASAAEDEADEDAVSDEDEEEAEDPDDDNDEEGSEDDSEEE
ncbi:MAG: hypothetical protein IKI56_01995 [Ruminococcus sp.]|nr:hypothetical protein [Ruminococcus sp.]